MNPSKTRLNRHNEPVGIHQSFSPKGMFLFGLPFLGAGCWITTIGLKIVEVDPSKVHAPMWVLTVIGLIFALSGCIVWSMAWQQARLLKRLKTLSAKYPGDAAMADYPWDRDGYSPPRWAPVRKAWCAALFMIIFSSVGNWVAFGSGDAPRFVQVMIALLDLILLWVLWYALKKSMHALKFGRTRLTYHQFPYRPGQSIQLEIQLPASLREGESATLTLRQILEYYIVSGHGKNRSKRLVQDVKYVAEQSVTRTQLAEWPGSIRSQWTLPATDADTNLHAEKPIFWELELKLQVPGIDLEQRYLVPVYGQ